MRHDTDSRINRLTGREVDGDEPALLGLASDAPVSSDESGPDGVAHTAGDVRLAALPVRAALVEVLDEWQERAGRGVERPALRLETSHVSRDTGGLYDLNAFERALQDDIDQLVWICVRPLQDLRYDEVIQPVGRVRRPARSATQQLSAHSEQWERWAPDFPIPKAILASIREDDIDLYENRVARTLVNGALIHLHRRLQQLQSHLNKNLQGRLVLLTGWHWRQERLRSSFDSQNVDTVIEMLELAVEELRSMAERLSMLERSPLFQGTDTRSRVNALRITNILRRDPRYRRVPPLWKLWSSTQDDDAEQLKRLDDPLLSQRGMDVLAEVLTAKALDWLGFTFDPSTESYRNGNASLTIDTPDDTTLVTVVDAVGSRQIRLVGLATPLRSHGQPDPLGSARQLDTWLKTHNGDTEHLVVLHPADADDIASVEHQERTLIDHTGVDAPDPTRTWAVIPATPLLVDALERVTRVLRWHLTAPVYHSSTMRMACGELDRRDRQTLDALTTCRLEGRELVIMEPLSDNDRQQLAAMSPRRPSSWLADLERVDSVHEALLQCPVFPSHRAMHTRFDRRDNGTFICSCKSCRSEWGTNICGSCGSTIPFIKPGKTVPDGELPSDFFGGDLLASLCEGATAADVEPVDGGPDLRVLICPNCRQCSKASRFMDCGRCSDRARTTS
jgi:hypothetical protein